MHKPPPIQQDWLPSPSSSNSNTNTTSSSTTTPRCQAMMRRLLYLPCSPELDLVTLRRMALALTHALLSEEEEEEERGVAAAVASVGEKGGGLREWWGLAAGAVAATMLLWALLLLPRWLLLLLPFLGLTYLVGLYPRVVAALCEAQGLAPGPSPLLPYVGGVGVGKGEGRMRELDAVAGAFLVHSRQREVEEGGRAVVDLTGAGPSVSGVKGGEREREREREKAVVLLSGGTGFVGHVVLADLLREWERVRAGGTDGSGETESGAGATPPQEQEQEQQPSSSSSLFSYHYGIDVIVLLLRPSPKRPPTGNSGSGSGIASRLSDLKSLPIFAPYVESGAWDAAVVGVEGDVARPRCGVSEQDRARLEGLGAYLPAV
jgi:hypothetical protein